MGRQKTFLIIFVLQVLLSWSWAAELTPEQSRRTVGLELEFSVRGSADRIHVGDDLNFSELKERIYGVLMELGLKSVMTWGIVHEHAPPDSHFGIELVTPPLTARQQRQIEAVSSHVLSIPGVEKTNYNATHFNIDISHLDWNQRVNLMLWIENNLPNIYSYLEPKRWDGKPINRYAIPMSARYPDLFLELSKLEPSQRNQDSVKQIFAIFNRTREGFKYSAANYQKMFGWRAGGDGQVIPIIEFRIADLADTPEAMEKIYELSRFIQNIPPEAISGIKFEPKFSKYRDLETINNELMAFKARADFAQDFKNFVQQVKGERTVGGKLAGTDAEVKETLERMRSQEIFEFLGSGVAQEKTFQIIRLMSASQRNELAAELRKDKGIVFVVGERLEHKIKLEDVLLGFLKFSPEIIVNNKLGEDPYLCRALVRSASDEELSKFLEVLTNDKVLLKQIYIRHPKLDEFMEFLTAKEQHTLLFEAMNEHFSKSSRKGGSLELFQKDFPNFINNPDNISKFINVIFDHMNEILSPEFGGSPRQNRYLVGRLADLVSDLAKLHGPEKVFYSRNANFKKMFLDNPFLDFESESLNEICKLIIDDPKLPKVLAKLSVSESSAKAIKKLVDLGGSEKIGSQFAKAAKLNPKLIQLGRFPEVKGALQWWFWSHRGVFLNNPQQDKKESSHLAARINRGLHEVAAGNPMNPGQPHALTRQVIDVILAEDTFYTRSAALRIAQSPEYLSFFKSLSPSDRFEFASRLASQSTKNDLTREFFKAYFKAAQRHPPYKERYKEFLSEILFSNDSIGSMDRFGFSPDDLVSSKVKRYMSGRPQRVGALEDLLSNSSSLRQVFYTSCGLRW